MTISRHDKIPSISSSDYSSDGTKIENMTRTFWSLNGETKWDARGIRRWMLSFSCERVLRVVANSAQNIAWNMLSVDSHGNVPYPRVLLLHHVIRAMRPGMLALNEETQHNCVLENVLFVLYFRKWHSLCVTMDSLWTRYGLTMDSLWTHHELTSMSFPNRDYSQYSI